MAGRKAAEALFSDPYGTFEVRESLFADRVVS
jgi:hypothetical protein